MTLIRTTWLEAVSWLWMSLAATTLVATDAQSAPPWLPTQPGSELVFEVKEHRPPPPQGGEATRMLALLRLKVMAVVNDGVAYRATLIPSLKVDPSSTDPQAKHWGFPSDLEIDVVYEHDTLIASFSGNVFMRLQPVSEWIKSENQANLSWAGEDVILPACSSDCQFSIGDHKWDDVRTCDARIKARRDVPKVLGEVGPPVDYEVRCRIYASRSAGPLRMTVTAPAFDGLSNHQIGLGQMVIQRVFTDGAETRSH